MKDKAIAKITDEAMKIDDPMAFAIEEHLTQLCTSNAVAEKLLAEDKSLKAAYDMIWKEASKRKKGRVAFIPPEEVYEMVDKYYGLDQAGRKTAKKQEPAAEHIDVLDLF